MVDLRALNAKLGDRSERIVMETTGIGREEARQALALGEGRVKPTIVMVRRGVDLAEADRLLEQHKGRLRDIIGDPPEVRTL
jgi:N-acetylmuramic acid 6-phosphate etherase